MFVSSERETEMIKAGDMIEIGTGTTWGGHFEVLEIVRTFKNGKVAVRVNFRGKPKVFHI
jgi:hypothetical protein